MNKGGEQNDNNIKKKKYILKLRSDFVFSFQARNNYPCLFFLCYVIS